jgi:hypothetical protein
VDAGAKPACCFFPRHDDLGDAMKIISSATLLFSLIWATSSAMAATYRATEIPLYAVAGARAGSPEEPFIPDAQQACNNHAAYMTSYMGMGTFTATWNGLYHCYASLNGAGYDNWILWVHAGYVCKAGDPPPVNGICGCPDGLRYDANTKQCVAAVCPVSPLTPITDPDFEQYETGKYSRAPELEHLTPGTAAGAQCIVREARNARVTAREKSGYRPAIYQTHIREVYDKWQLLEGNQDPVCAEVKAQVLIEWNRHGPFAAQPGKTSNHSDGRAVDIGFTNYEMADTIAARCQMWRRLPNDKPHFEPLR